MSIIRLILRIYKTIEIQINRCLISLRFCQILLFPKGFCIQRSLKTAALDRNDWFGTLRHVRYTCIGTIELRHNSANIMSFLIFPFLDRHALVLPKVHYRVLFDFLMSLPTSLHGRYRCKPTTEKNVIISLLLELSVYLPIKAVNYLINCLHGIL